MNWTSFFIGLAIGLWIAVVAFLLRPVEDQQPYIVVSGATGGAQSASNSLWIPSNDGVYRCTNNDHGGGVVEDHGRGVVEDHGGGTVEDHGGGTVEDHGGGTVEDHGGGNVEHGAAHVPAPVAERGYQQYWCDLNQYGGPIVRHRDGRIVVVAMPVADALPGTGPFTCERDPSGNAVVVNSSNEHVDVDHGGGTVEDHGGGTVEDSGSGKTTPTSFAADSLLDGQEEASQLTGTQRVYCMVLERDSAPQIVDVDGEPVSTLN